MEFTLAQGSEVLSATPGVLAALLDQLSDAWLSGDEGAGTWSPYQVLGHLTHIEETDWIDRTRVILEHDPGAVFAPIDREAGFARFEGWPASDLLQRFATVRSANLETLGRLVRPDLLQRRGVHPDFGAVTLTQLLATWVVHDLNHVGQIVKTMSKQYADAVGPWRAYLPIIDAQ